MKENQNKLLGINFFYSLGGAIVGVFLPFLVAKAFNFEIWELMIWLTGYFFAGFLITIPLNQFLAKYFSVKRNVQLGLAFLAIFYLIISFGQSSAWWIILATFFFLIGIFTFWPSFHLLNLHSTKEAGRGNYIGKLQAITVSANIITPLISGFLLDHNLESWISLVAAVCFGLAIWFGQKLNSPTYQISNFRGLNKFFREKFLPSAIFKITIVEGLQKSVLWAVWPIFFKSILVGFTQMGWFVSFTAVVEIFSAKFFGKFTDRQSAKKSLKLASVLRCFELISRGFIFWFPVPLMAGIASFVAGAFGPLYNISLYSRSMELVEEHQTQDFNFIIVHEVFLSLIKAIVYFFAIFITFYWGVKFLVILVLGAGLSSLFLFKN